MLQNLNSQITNELSEPSPFFYRELSAGPKITQGTNTRVASDTLVSFLLHWPPRVPSVSVKETWCVDLCYKFTSLESAGRYFISLW